MIVNWWLLVTLAGAAVLPLCVRLLSWLPDRGYTLARAAGLLLTAFVFWLLTSFGFLRNDPGGITLAWLIVLGVGLIIYFRGALPFDWRDWWRENRGGVITAEVLFALLLLGWSIYRAHQNSLAGTEKPMDLAFMSGIMRSPTFPPNDPWLSGYAISYYYFGYVISAMLSTMSGVASTIGYNLWTAMLFALTGVTTFGVVYNLIRSRRATQRASALMGVIGVVVLLIFGNYEGPLVEIPYQTGTASAEYLRFWDVNLRNVPLATTPSETGLASNPLDWGFDFFRSARTLNDRNLPQMVAQNMGEREEVINEFPMFSFLLADNHPHVMALPFTILVIGLALNVVLSPRRPNIEEGLFYGICVGALVFLNTWDNPTYIVVLVGADVLRRLLRDGRLQVRDWMELFVFGVSLLLITLTAYFPFLVGFRSQLSGALPNLIYPTLFQQYFLAFGPLLPLVILFLLVEIWRGQASRRMNWSLGLQVVGVILMLILITMLFLVILGTLVPDIRTGAQDFIERSGGWATLLPTILEKRLTHIITTVVLLLMLLVIVARIFPKQPEKEKVGTEDNIPDYPPATGFALMLVGAAVMVTFIPEFVYLRDVFSTRMNTVFKFYYQAWTLFAIASAYGLYTLFADVELRLPVLTARTAAGVVAGIAAALGLVYPLFGIYNQMQGGTRIFVNETQMGITLDGWRTVVLEDDYETLTCLSDLVGDQPVVVAEATGGSYDFFVNATTAAGRTGALTGMPSVIGWIGHQSQWRGSGYGEAVGSRPDEIRRLYTDLRIDIAAEIIEKYGIDYILYGPVERSTEYYGLDGEAKFMENFSVVCEHGASRIYRTSDVIINQ